MIVDEHREVARLKDVVPVFSKTLPVVEISAEDTVLELNLYENDAVGQLLKQLPQTLVMTRWGDGAYGGSLSGKIEITDGKREKRNAFFKGEVVIRQKRNSLFLMFGATPAALTVDEPMLSGGIPVGRLKDYSALKHLSGVVEFSIKVRK